MVAKASCTFGSKGGLDCLNRPTPRKFVKDIFLDRENDMIRNAAFQTEIARWRKLVKTPD
jgi:hypothetical protein